MMNFEVIYISIILFPHFLHDIFLYGCRLEVTRESIPMDGWPWMQGRILSSYLHFSSIFSPFLFIFLLGTVGLS